MIRHELGVSENGTGSERIFQVSGGTRNSATRQVLWTSARLEQLSQRGLKSVSSAFPAARLKRQNHLVQLSGVPANDTFEFVTAYALRAVVK